MQTVSIPKVEYDDLLAMKEEYSELKQTVKFLVEQIALSKKRQFGSSSERIDQVSLFDEAENNFNPNIKEPQIEEVRSYRRKKSAERKGFLPDNLEIEEKEYIIDKANRICPECGNVMSPIGKDVRERLKIIPAKAVIFREIRYTYACGNCEKNGTHTPIIKAEWPHSLISGSLATPESVAHIIEQKFVMGSPLYRQEQELERSGILLSRQTMSNWLIYCSKHYLQPIYDQLKKQLVQKNILHADETTLQVLHEEGKTPQSKSYMWLYRTGKHEKHPIVLYEYRPDRSGGNAREFLKDFHGYLHCDGYSGYHKMPDDIKIVGCWAHARRKLDEALKVMKKEDRPGSMAAKGLNYCSALFRIEDELGNVDTHERCKERLKRAKPLIDEFYEWIESLNYSSKTTFGKACKYAINQKKYLYAYLADGDLVISNNIAERSIKPFVIARKNFLFANTPNGAQASATIFSLLETAKEEGISTYRYISWVLESAAGKDLINNPELASQLTPEAFRTARV